MFIAHNFILDHDKLQRKFSKKHINKKKGVCVKLKQGQKLGQMMSRELKSISNQTGKMASYF